MVRFSDMLGGSGDAAGARATNSPYAALASDKPEADDEPDSDEPDTDEPDTDEPGTDEPDTEVVTSEVVAEPVTSGFESPEAVLDRLTQYATSARAADHTPAPNEELHPVASDDTIDTDTDTDTEDEPAAADDPLSTPGDDLLPRPKAPARRAGRGRKRRP